jgi:hypothetical protein
VTVRASLNRVPIEHVARDRAGILARDFVSSERSDLAARPDRTIAGRLAAKRALCELWSGLFPGLAADPRDFVLACEASGAPRLLAAFGQPPPASIGISIAHSQFLAVGLVAAPFPGGRE